MMKLCIPSLDIPAGDSSKMTAYAEMDFATGVPTISMKMPNGEIQQQTIDPNRFIYMTKRGAQEILKDMYQEWKARKDNDALKRGFRSRAWAMKIPHARLSSNFVRQVPEKLLP